GYDSDDLKAMVPGNVAGYLGIDKPTSNGEVAEAPEEVDTEAPEEPIREGGDNRLLPVTNTNPDPTSEPDVIAEETVAPVVDAGENGLDSIGGASQLPVTEGAVGTPEPGEDATEEA